jgi:hypothetical protein
MSKNKKVSFNKTQANVLVLKLAGNSKHIEKASVHIESLIMCDIYLLGSYCSTYDYKSKGHTSYIKSELISKNLYGSESNSKSYINRLFQCSNSLLMREVFGINQTSNQIKSTLEKLKLHTRYAILDYIKTHELTENGKVIAKPKVEKEDKPKAEKIENLNNAQFLDRIYQAINEKIEDKSCKEYQEFATKINQDAKHYAEEKTKAELEKIA